MLPFIEWTPRKKLDAIYLLDEAQGRYEQMLVENFRWMKGLIFDEIERQDAESAVRWWWEQDEFDLAADYWDGLPVGSQN